MLYLAWTFYYPVECPYLYSLYYLFIKHFKFLCYFVLKFMTFVKCLKKKTDVTKIVKTKKGQLKN